MQFTNSPRKNTVRCRYSNMKKGNVTQSASILIRESLLGTRQSIQLETPAKHEEKEKIVSEFENTEVRKEIEREKNKRENVRIGFPCKRASKFVLVQIITDLIQSQELGIKINHMQP